MTESAISASRPARKLSIVATLALGLAAGAVLALTIGPFRLTFVEVLAALTIGTGSTADS